MYIYSRIIIEIKHKSRYYEKNNFKNTKTKTKSYLGI